jgi:NAD(P)-dependent dehydrogenase (short-subunit alcohol dehydrogenase family)
MEAVERPKLHRSPRSTSRPSTCTRPDVVAKTGGVDICFNAIGVHAVQGTPLTELALGDFSYPIIAWTATQFVTSRAAARHMIERRRGVIIIGLAAELGTYGVRVVCLRPHRIADSGLNAERSVNDGGSDEPHRWNERGLTLVRSIGESAQVRNTRHLCKRRQIWSER